MSRSKNVMLSIVEPQSEEDRKTVVEASRVRPRKLDWIAVVLIGLILQAFWASRLSQPTYMDAYYYATNGQRLASGYGFSETIIWQYLDNPQGLPTPSHTYWMPLSSILAAAGSSIREGFAGLQFFFWLLGGLLPLLSYNISWQLSHQRWQSWGAALFTAIGGFYAAFLSQPTTFAPFAWAGGLSLFALGMATAFSPRGTSDGKKVDIMPKWERRLWWLVAGLMAGLAHLTRADGFILLFVGMLIWALEMFKRFFPVKTNKDEPVRRLVGNTAINLGLLLLGYLVTMGWWLIRNLNLFGRPLPTAGVQSIFLTTYDDLFAYGRVIDLTGYLDWGIVNILQSKVEGSWLALQTFIAVPGFIFLTPFIIAAIIGFARNKLKWTFIRPAILFAVILFISNALIFTFPGGRGSLFHSSIALWPWATAFAVAGIGLAVDWAAKKLPHWQPERAKRIFTGLFLAVALIMTFFIGQARLAPDENPEIYRRVGQMVPASSVVMAGNAPALQYYSGLPAISVPNEDIETVITVIDRYGVTHLLLNQNRPKPLDEIYQGTKSHPRLSLLWTEGDTKIFEVKKPLG